HHIIVSGIERKTIFIDNADRDNFLERLKNILTDSDTSYFAWALIPHHFHSHKVQARSLVCFWASRELGMSMAQLSKRLNISQLTASRSATRGEKMASVFWSIEKITPAN
ncbi:MAG: hypothetical protein JRJ20_00155, partial [Deltaproteobacteria bacterium]|nr:hypothetical protein [Deltaproteobacteria bacterium]